MLILGVQAIGQSQQQLNFPINAGFFGRKASVRGIDIAAHAEAAYLSDEEPVELGSPQRVMS